MPSKIPELEDDGLFTREVSDYAEEKYRLIGLYCELFAKAMKGKWDRRVYLDLYAGAGRSRIKNTKKILSASPLLALGVTDKFDRYIFSEMDPMRLYALKLRVSRDYPELDVQYVQGDTNKNSDEIIAKIPKHSSTFKVLSFCFVDPDKLDNLRFATIRQLATRYIDFLVLIPSGMDANRNVDLYFKEENTVVDNFLGTSAWRESWVTSSAQGESFERFIAHQFGLQMSSLGYLYSGIEEMKPVRLTEKNVLLYRLAFFSRNETGKKFWEQARRYADDQRTLF